MSLYYSRMPGPRRSKAVALPEGAEAIYFPGSDGEKILCGYICQRHPAEETSEANITYQAYPGGWDCFSSGKRPLYTAPTKEDAIALLTAKYKNRAIARDFKDFFEAKEDD